jgi:hypothetical protein
VPSTRLSFRVIKLTSAVKARALILLVAMLAVASVPLGVASRNLASEAAFVLLMLPFAIVGVIVARRQPGNAIGWIMLLLAVIVIGASDAGSYGLVAYQFGHSGLPLGRVAVALAPGWVALVLLLPLPVLLFPDGRAPAGVWRATLWAYIAFGGLVVAAIAIGDVKVFSDRHLQLDSIGELSSFNASNSHDWVTTLVLVMLLGYALLAMSWVVRQVVSYRRSAGVRRQQLKWMLAGGTVCIVGLVAALAAHSSSSTIARAVVAPIGFSAVAALPVGIGVGILKYRLYDIDRLISRTVSYAFVTGVLVSAYVAMIALTTRVISFSSSVGVAASTLIAAGLFTPVRRRVQHSVDRHFNRSRYDADLIVAAFAAHLRESVTLDDTTADLLDTVRRAVEPAHASLWIATTTAATSTATP